MLLSISWWIYVQLQGPSIYQIAILGLQQDESILSEYYSKTVTRPTIPGAEVLHDEYFIVAQDQPLKIGDRFEFYYFKTPASPTVAAPVGQPAGIGLAGTQVDIKYSGNKLDTYEVAQSGSAVSLKIVASNQSMLGARLASAAAALPWRSDQ